MVECTNTGSSRRVFQRREQTGKSDRYGLWPPRFAEAQKKIITPIQGPPGKNSVHPKAPGNNSICLGTHYQKFPFIHKEEHPLNLYSPHSTQGGCPPPPPKLPIKHDELNTHGE